MHLRQVLVVDDGMPLPEARALDGLAAELGFPVVRLPRNRGKGHAVVAGLTHALERSSRLGAVLVLDGDGQHPPAAIPSFLAAAEQAELVIGDRFGDLSSMPAVRQAANRISSRLLAARSGAPVADSQCGMRLLHGQALHEVRFRGGRYEAETVHLRRCLERGVTIAWVPIQTRYNSEVSSFRPLRDTALVLRALLS